MPNFIKINTELKGFINTNTRKVRTITDTEMLLVEGELESNTEYCPLCNSKMHTHDTFEQDLRHLPIGSTLITIRLKRKRYICPYCHCYKMQEAIEERCEHIQVVFDPFHIRKNFSDKLISQIRKDEQRRLLFEGDKAGADMLKRTKYILTSSPRKH